MNKVILNIRYKIGYQLSWVTWYLVIYTMLMFLIFYLLIKFSIINQGEGSLVYRLWGAIIVQFAWTMRFKEDFDFLITLSHTRDGIFLSLVGVAIGFSIFFSGLIVLERLIVDHLNHVFGFHNITDPFHLFAPYARHDVFVQFLFFFVLCVCFSLFGLLMGSLFYRFGKKFILAFWLIFSAVPIVFFPILLWRGQLSESIRAAGAFLNHFDVPAASGFLFIFTIVFGMAAYLNIRRLPQK